MRKVSYVERFKYIMFCRSQIMHQGGEKVETVEKHHGKHYANNTAHFPLETLKQNVDKRKQSSLERPQL